MTTRRLALPRSNLNLRIPGYMLLALGVLLFFLSGWGFQWTPGQTNLIPETGILRALAGTVAVLVGFWMVRPAADPMPVATGAGVGSTTPLRVMPLTLGVLSMLAFTEANLHRLFPTVAVSQHIQMGLFVGGCLLLVYGAGGLVDFRPANWLSRSYLPLYAILGLALFIRVHGLDTDVHFMIDERHFYTGIVNLWRQPNEPVLRSLNSIAQFTHFFSYLEQISYSLIGGEFFGVRLPSALFGTLTVFAMYLFGRNLGDELTGLIAAALLAVFPPHIHFSKLALNNIAELLFGVLAFAFLLSALRDNRQRDYVLAGCFWGLTAYWYEGGRLVFLGVMLLWVALVVVVRRPRTHWRGLLLMLAIGLTIFFPYYYFILSKTGGIFAPRVTASRRLGDFLTRLGEEPASVVLTDYWEKALRPVLLHVFYVPDKFGFYYGGGVAILHWFTVPLVLMGAVFGLLRQRLPTLLLLGWIGAALLGISFTAGVTWTVRYCVIFPALMMLATFGVRYLLVLLESAASVFRVPDFRPYTVPLLAALIVGLVGYLQLRYYYMDHLPLYNETARLEPYDYYDAWDRTIQYKGVDTLIFTGESYVHDPVLVVMRDLRGVTMAYEVWKPSEGLTEKLAALPKDKTYVFALAPDDPATYEAINAVFPLRVMLPWSRYPNVPLNRQYLLYLVEPPLAAP